MNKAIPLKHILPAFFLFLFLIPGKQNVLAQSPYLPTQGFSTTDTFITNGWSRNPYGLSYRYQLALDPGFSSIVRDTDNLINNTLYTKGLSQSTTYFWRVYANLSSGPGSWSASSSFTVFTPKSLDTSMLFWYPIEKNSLTYNASRQVTFCHDQSRYYKPLKQVIATRGPIFNDSIRILNNTGVMNFTPTLLNQVRNDSIQDSIQTIIFVLDNYKGDVKNPIGVFSLNAYATIGMGNYSSAISTEGFIWMGDTSLSTRYDVTAIRQPLNNYFNIITLNLNKSRNMYETYLNGVKVAPLYYLNDTATGKRPYKSSIFALGYFPLYSQYYSGNIAEVIGCRRSLDSLSLFRVHNYLISKMAPPANLGPDVISQYGYCNLRTLNPGNHFVRYQWSTGDTSYTLPITRMGTYWVSCTDAFGRISRDTVVFGIRDTFYQAKDTTVCYGQTVTWTTKMLPIYRFLWQDGSTDSFIVMRNPGKYYCRISDTLGCFVYTDTVRFSIDSFEVQNSLGPDTIFCSGNSIGLQLISGTPVSYLWSTGDTTALTPVISAGSYWVSVTNPRGCVAKDTLGVSVKGYAPLMAFTATNACLGDTSRIFDLSGAVPPETIVSWDWRFGDGDSAFVPAPDHYYSAPGNYSVRLVVTTDSGCSNFATRNLTVFQIPSAFFTSVIACKDAPAFFADQSTPPPGDSLVYWKWVFNLTDSIFLRNPRYEFGDMGRIPVSLTVASNGGCYNTYLDTVDVFPPLNPDFSYNNICLGDTTAFRDISASVSIVQREWNFDNGAAYAFTASPKYIFTDTGTYWVSLKVRNSIGCIDSSAKQIDIYSLPIALFTDSIGCLRVPHTFTDLSTCADDTIRNWTWAVDTMRFYVQNPAIVFGSAGVYPMTLNVATPHGCRSSFTRNIDIKSPPTADFSYTPNYGQAPIDISFTNSSTGAATYAWNFGDGTGSSSETNPVYTYTADGSYRPVLVAVSPFGCVDSVSKLIQVRPSNLDIQVDELRTYESVLANGVTELKISVRLINVGTRDITSADLLARLENGSTLLEHWSGLITPGTSINYVYSTSFYVTNLLAAEYICVEAINLNDGTETNFLNNKVCANIHTDVVVGEPYPVPATEEVKIDVFLNQETALNIGIYDELGQIISKPKNYTGTKGLNTYQLDTKGIRSGQYYLRIKYFSSTEVKKIQIGK